MNKNKGGLRRSGKCPDIPCSPACFRKDLPELRSKMDHTYVYKNAAREVFGKTVKGILN